MSISDYYENVILDTLDALGCYIKLHVGAPGEAGTANAATETTRKSIAFDAASGGEMDNTSQIQWTSVAGSEDYTHFSLWDDLTAGNCLWTGTITANPVTAGDTFQIDAGGLTLTLD